MSNPQSADLADSAMATKSRMPSSSAEKGSLGVAILRVVLGLIILSVWWGNVTQDPNFYSGDGIRGFFDWVFSDPESEGGGNGSSLGFVESIIDATVLQAPGFFGFAQMIVELLIGIALVVGLFTRLASGLAFAFFVGLFFTYFGGEEWIGVYIMLVVGALTVFLSWGGRMFGADQAIYAAKGDSPGKLLW